jgi:hypothetical protein
VLIGAPVSRQLQGEDLLAEPRKGTAYSEGKGLESLKFQTEEWSLIASDSMTKFELYDLTKDPGEIVNLHSQRPEIAQELAQQLLKQYREDLQSPYRPEKHTGALSQSTIEQLKSLGYVD